jgi:hypothetical protein
MNMDVGQVDHSGLTLKLRVHQLVKIIVGLVDSDMMMQFCHHDWELKNLEQWA